jgi:superoxide reductase
MANRLELYKCEVCGNIVEVLHAGAGELVCCGQPMDQLVEKTEEQGMEKHLPIIEKTESGILVKVGSIQHPMENEHYIELIEVISGEQISRKFLKPGEVPEAEFIGFDENATAREHCTIHGLWKK